MKQKLEFNEDKLLPKELLLNKHVTIYWKDNADWHWFKIIGYSYGWKLNSRPTRWICPTCVSENKE